MNTRRMFIAGGVAFSGAALLTRPTSASQPTASHRSRKGSKALESATQASLADTFFRYKSGDRQAFKASATASIRLMAAMFENQDEVGDLALDEDYLLSHEDSMRYFSADDAFIEDLHIRLANIGVQITTQELRVHLLAPTQFEIEKALSQIKKKGLKSFYRVVLMSIESDLGYSTVRYDPRVKPRLLPVQLDQISCDIIFSGIIAAMVTGNVIAGATLALWRYASC